MRGQRHVKELSRCLETISLPTHSLNIRLFPFQQTQSRDHHEFFYRTYGPASRHPSSTHASYFSCAARSRQTPIKRPIAINRSAHRLARMRTCFLCHVCAVHRYPLETAAGLATLFFSISILPDVLVTLPSFTYVAFLAV